MKHSVLIVKGNRRVAYSNNSLVSERKIRRAIYLLSQEINLDRTVIHFKKRSMRIGGRAFDGMPGMVNLDGLRRGQWRYLIVVYTEGFYPWPSVLAHEAVHIEQYRERKPRSEVSADNFAHHWYERVGRSINGY